MKPVYIHTVGDSTLDNLFWVLSHKLDVKKAKSDSVEGQLEKLCNSNSKTKYKVISHAYDGFTTKSVLTSDEIGRVLPKNGQIKATYLREKQKECSVVAPLVELKRSIENAPDAEHFVVLSVGGNDFRENLTNPLKLLWDISSIQKRYIQIVQEIQSIQSRKCHLILMLQYKTDKNNDPYRIYPLMKVLGVFARCVQATSLAALFACTMLTRISWVTTALFGAFGALGLYASSTISPLNRILTHDSEQTFDQLAQFFYKPILAHAKEHKIPVLDLRRIFDPKKPLYTCGIEPNVEGGRLIAEGLTHIIKNASSSL